MQAVQRVEKQEEEEEEQQQQQQQAWTCGRPALPWHL
jgi:hypothetical protein